MTKEELKNKYSAFITEISEILGLGKPIDVLKLCATTDLFFQPLEKHIVELEKENAELKESNKMLEQGYVWHDYDAGEDCYEDTHEGKWVKRDEVYYLTEIKELLKNWVNRNS